MLLLVGGNVVGVGVGFTVQLEVWVGRGVGQAEGLGLDVGSQAYEIMFNPNKKTTVQLKAFFKSLHPFIFQYQHLNITIC